jgi:hypothetical protein
MTYKEIPVPPRTAYLGNSKVDAGGDILTLPIHRVSAGELARGDDERLAMVWSKHRNAY